jgi:hypothetical protein
MHRMNFFGRPAGPNTVSWQYNGQPWQFQRPEDGQPPVVRLVRCAVCRKALTYRVHSVLDTQLRYRRKRLLAWAGLAVFLCAGAVLIALVVSHHTTALGLAVTIPTGLLGFQTLWVAGLAVAEETGVTGHLNTWPSSTARPPSTTSPAGTRPEAGRGHPA